MSNVTASDVQNQHTPIPDADLASIIPTFITDAEAWIKARLAICGIAVNWTDATEPAIIRLLVKQRATWFELKKLYGSQVEEFHDWVREFKTEPDDLLNMICEAAKKKEILPPGLSYAISTSSIYRSTTKGRKKIFTLEDEKDWIFHPEDDDPRYGEE